MAKGKDPEEVFYNECKKYGLNKEQSGQIVSFCKDIQNGEVNIGSALQLLQLAKR